MNPLLWNWLSGLLISSFIIPVQVNTSLSQPTQQNQLITVNSLLDEVDRSPGDGECLTITEKCTLHAAIQEANALPALDTIQLSEGIYPITRNGMSEDRAESGDFDITDDLILRGVGRTHTVIDGNMLDRVFQISGAISVTLQSLTITNGFAPAQQNGGGISIEKNAHVTLNELTIQQSSTGLNGRGGAIFNAQGQLQITHSTLKENISRTAGGAIFNKGTLTVMDSAISGNHAFDHAGGIYNEGDTRISTSLIAGNQAGGKGGGIYNTATLQASLAVIIHNVARGNDGGIYSSGSKLQVNDSILADNLNQNCELVGSTVAGQYNIESGTKCGLPSTLNFSAKSVLLDLVLEYDQPLFTSQEVYRRYWAELNTIQQEQAEFQREFATMKERLNTLEKQTISLLLDTFPGSSSVKGIIELFTGTDLITGESLGAWRWSNLLELIPFLGAIENIPEIRKLFKLSEYHTVVHLITVEMKNTAHWWEKPAALATAINRYRRLRTVLNSAPTVALLEFIVHDAHSVTELLEITSDFAKPTRRYVLTQWYIKQVFRVEQRRLLLPQAGRIVDHLQGSTAWKIEEQQSYSLLQLQQDLKDFRRLLEMGNYHLTFLFDEEPAPEIIRTAEQAGAAVCWQGNYSHCPELN